ncbi:uncharacterized protein LOC132266598 [Cornus florida]|uniref:uncharacterized protein LOC132266598 n=1 Tax=Cornus florida TaxID=4283 RepID=UPI00289D5F4C|nr:uncharacterized protein LOC132266598 [Cornus florida]
METPSSTTRVTRSQALASANSNNNIPMSRKIEESEKGVSKSRQRSVQQQDRSALIDITNDSPIVGLAMGSLTPSSAMSKKKSNSQANHNTPGSGEALLRGQVKTLLQRVEEEAELSKLSLEHRPFSHLVQSPMGLLAPTPANTPDVLNLSGNEETFKNICLASVTPSPIQEQFEISQMEIETFDVKEEGLESEKSLITRSLLLDFSDKSDGSDSSHCSSVLTYIGGGDIGSVEKSNTDDDNASAWSMQVNASSSGYGEEDNEGIEEVEEEEEDDYEDYEEEDEYDEGLVDELCEGLNKISVNGEKKMAKFTGKHTRFVYNSDGELEGEEECGGEKEESSAVSPCVLRLKGLPTPNGKHLRFPEELEEDDH